MRVGIASIALESNTFNPNLVTLDDFRANTLLVGDEARSLSSSPHEVGGFLAGLVEAEIEAVPLLAASAVAGGVASSTTYQTLCDLLDRELDRAGPLDGVLLAPHGAMVAENVADADGDWMEHVRQRVGPTVPIIATCDPHANVSRRMIDTTDALIAYRTNPHLDQRERGIEAASLIAQTLRGAIRPVQAAAFPPMLIGIERQLTAEPPCSTLSAVADRLRSEPAILSASLILGFPYADVPEMGSAVIVVANDDVKRAAAAAAAFGDAVWKKRADLVGCWVTAPAAVAVAGRSPGTTGLLDMGDNVGGGSPGDGTSLLHELICQGVGPSLAILCDAAAAASAIAAGIGSRLQLSIGGKVDTSERPIAGTFDVVAITDGVFDESEVRHGGRNRYDQGPTAVVRDDHMTIIVTSRSCSPFSLGQVTHTSLDPRDFRAVVIKGVHAPVAAYAPVCDRLLRVDTPGLTAADPTRFPFMHRRRPMYPFEPATGWMPHAE